MSAKNKTILIVDDDADIRELIGFNLKREGYEILQCGDGETALDIAKDKTPDLIILDVMLPGLDGIEVCFRIKSDNSMKSIPVLMLSAKSDETDQLVGLKIGADDYMTKPFSPHLLVAKVNAILRRQENIKESATHQDEQPLVNYRNLSMNPNSFTVTLGGEPLKLTAVEYKILYFLASKPGRVYSRERIIEKARGDDVIITERTVDVHILSLRRKLGDQASAIETVRGIGYRLSEEN